MILGIAGYKRSGKSTAAQYLAHHYGFRQDSYAGPIRAFVASMLGWSAQELEDRKEEPLPWLGGLTPRYLMQHVGTQWGREMIHPDLWVLAALRRAQGTLAAGYPVLFSDVRFANEAQAIRERGGKVIRVNRAGLESTDDHASERPIPADLVDEEIPNDGSIRDLYIELDSAMQRLGVEPRYLHGPTKSAPGDLW